MAKIKIIIAEDQSLLLGALSALLALEADFEIVGLAQTGRAALDLMQTSVADVMLSDIEMHELSGLDLALAMQKSYSTTRLIIMTTFARAGYLRRALDAGVMGYLLKDAPASELAAAIRKVCAGGRVIAPELALEAWSERDPLNQRERQVLQLAAEGLSASHIAAKIFLSEGTVRNYLSEASSKLGARNRIEAARIARAKGWL